MKLFICGELCAIAIVMTLYGNNIERILSLEYIDELCNKFFDSTCKSVYASTSRLISLIELEQHHKIAHFVQTHLRGRGCPHS